MHTLKHTYIQHINTYTHGSQEKVLQQAKALGIKVPATVAVRPPLGKYQLPAHSAQAPLAPSGQLGMSLLGHVVAGCQQPFVLGQQQQCFRSTAGNATTNLLEQVVAGC